LVLFVVGGDATTTTTTRVCMVGAIIRLSDIHDVDNVVSPLVVDYPFNHDDDSDSIISCL
jgi:hypothetical protein